MKFLQALLAALLISFLASCSGRPATRAIDTIAITPTAAPTKEATPTASPTNPPTPTVSPTERPLTLVFYGDSQLKVGDAERESTIGFSIVDILRPELNHADQVITSNFGGRKAKWGYENLEKNVLAHHPGLVTIWWGINDLNGCPGIFDRSTDSLLQYELTALVNDHIHYMELQIEAVLKTSTPVIVITPFPTNGTFPWSHLDAKYQVVWEYDYRCDFNSGLEQLVQAQRQMVAGYAARQEPVYLVDSWQIYKDHPNSDNMYMDIVHPGEEGAELIAERWLQIYQSIKR
ncbi:MAG TPA: SGNH/GDSL hydrolase family protein [Anaerolineales bacterium]|nr:SGNH/GDSL hydrolase family protein [Anaerolineales bacterium]